jgi:hypothetical protein
MVGQQRNLLAAQTVGAATSSTGQPDVLGLQGRPAVTQELGQQFAIHDNHYG